MSGRREFALYPVVTVYLAYKIFDNPEKLIKLLFGLQN